MTVFMVAGATFWVGAEYAGMGGSGTDHRARPSTCMFNSDAGETGCSTVSAKGLSSPVDGDQDPSQRTYSASTASTSKPVINFEAELADTIDRDTQPDINDTDSTLALGITETDEYEAANFEQVQHIGEFIDPEAENFGALTGSGTPISIGKFIDPDGDLPNTLNDAREDIGTFIDPDGSLTSRGQGKYR